MFSLSWLRERGLTRARPMIRRRVARTTALGFLIAGSLLLTGCQSGPFSRHGFPARATSRVIIQPIKRLVGCCGADAGTMVSEGSIDYGTPVNVVTPVMPVAPFGTATPVIEGSPIPSSVTPANSDTPSNLEPLPRAEPGPGPSSRNSSGVRKPSTYDAQRPAVSPARGDNLARTMISSPDPAVQPARDSATARNKTTTNSDFDSVFDKLPPMDLPTEVTEGSDSPPVAPAAVKPQPTAASASPTPAAAPASTSANDHLDGRSAEDAAMSLAANSPPAPDVTTTSSEAIGIKRFFPADLRLAGGSLPSTVGLGWLAERGYKTILDLRDSSQISSAFIGEVRSRGLRYVALPTDLEKLDRAQIESFSFELSLNDARPLYFFDDDGRRAGAMWFIRRVLTDKASWEVARREAEEIGLTDAASWDKTRDCVDRQLAPRAPASVPAGSDKSTPTIQPAAQSPEAAPVPAAPAPTPTPQPPAQAQAIERHVVASPEVMAKASFDADPNAWQPLAAMILTGLTFPLAYISRAVIPTMLAKSLASLPGPAQRRKSLPPASDA